MDPNNNNTKTKKRVLLLFAIAVCLLYIFAYYESRLPEPLPFENKIELELKWERTFNNRISPNWDISQFGELVCINNKNEVYFMDSKLGNLNNQEKLDEVMGNKILRMDNKNIYIINNNKKVNIMDLKTGKLKKTIKSEKKILYDEHVILYNDYLLFWTEDGMITTVNVHNDEINNKRLFRDDHIFYLNVYKGMIFYTKLGFNIYALDLKNLKQKWNYDIGDHKAGSEPVILNNKIYLIIPDEILAFDLLNGNIVDRYNSYDGNTIYTDKKDLYVSTLKFLFKINKDTGDIIWKINEYVSISSLKFIDDHIYFESGKQPLFVKVKKKIGIKIWESDLRDFSFDINKAISTSKYDIIERNDGYIFILDKNTGEKLWRFNNTVDQEDLRWKVYDNKLIIFDGLNKFYAYDLSEI